MKILSSKNTIHGDFKGSLSAHCYSNNLQFHESIFGSEHTQTVKLEGESSDGGYCLQHSREFQTNPS